MTNEEARSQLQFDSGTDQDIIPAIWSDRRANLMMLSYLIYLRCLVLAFRLFESSRLQACLRTVPKGAMAMRANFVTWLFSFPLTITFNFWPYFSVYFRSKVVVRRSKFSSNKSLLKGFWTVNLINYNVGYNLIKRKQVSNDLLVRNNLIRRLSNSISSLCNKVLRKILGSLRSNLRCL